MSLHVNYQMLSNIKYCSIITHHHFLENSGFSGNYWGFLSKNSWNIACPSLENFLWRKLRRWLGLEWRPSIPLWKLTVQLGKCPRILCDTLRFCGWHSSSSWKIGHVYDIYLPPLFSSCHVSSQTLQNIHCRESPLKAKYAESIQWIFRVFRDHLGN